MEYAERMRRKRPWVGGPLQTEARAKLEANGWVCREMSPGWWEARPKAEWEAMDPDEMRVVTTLAEMRAESVRIALDGHRARWARASRDDRWAVLGLLRVEAADPQGVLTDDRIQAFRAAIAVLESLEPAGDAAGKDATP